MLKYFRHKNPRGSSAWFIELRPKLSADKYNNSPEGGHPLVMQDVSNTQVALMTGCNWVPWAFGECKSPCK